MDANLEKVTGFLTEIQLPWEWCDTANGFMPNIDIKDGVLLISPNAEASDLLHEAGHLATIPENFRHLAQSNIAGVHKIMLGTLDNVEIDSKSYFAIIQCDDSSATAWAWAVGEYLQLEPEQIIKDSEYDGTGADIRMMLTHRQYCGINGLHYAGFCAIRKNAFSEKQNMPAYPELAYWLQKSF